MRRFLSPGRSLVLASAALAASCSLSDPPGVIETPEGGSDSSPGEDGGVTGAGGGSAGTGGVAKGGGGGEGGTGGRGKGDPIDAGSGGADGGPIDAGAGGTTEAGAGGSGGSATGGEGGAPCYWDVECPPKLVGLSGTQKAIVVFDSELPAAAEARELAGLPPQESILDIDFRPATNELIGVGVTGRLYVIDPQTAGVTPLGSQSVATFATTSVGVDFSPVVDRMRVVYDNVKSLRANPGTASATAYDIDLAYDAADVNHGVVPRITGVAYTAGPTPVLYAIDTNLDVLVTIGNQALSPNAGVLFTVGSLGVDALGVAGFDISLVRGIAAAALTLPGNGVSHMYLVNLATGAAQRVGAGPIGTANQTIRGLAIVPPGVTL